MMNWERICNWEIEEKDNKLFITLSVNHIHGTRNFTEETYDKEFVENFLQKNNIRYKELISDAVVYNHLSYRKCTGTWIFSLPTPIKTKKTTKPVEKKQSVPKITNKKTIKK